FFVPTCHLLSQSSGNTLRATSDTCCHIRSSRAAVLGDEVAREAVERRCEVLAPLRRPVREQFLEPRAPRCDEAVEGGAPVVGQLATAVVDGDEPALLQLEERLVEPAGLDPVGA